MNFIFFVSQNFSDRNYNRYGIDYFKKNKFNYKILDLSDIFDKKIKKISSKYQNKKNFKNLYKFNNYYDLFLFLIKQNKFCYANTCTYNSFLLAIIERVIILKGNIKIYFSTALVPKIDRDYLLESKLLLKKFHLFYLLKKIINYSKNKLIFLLQPLPKVAFLSGYSELNKFKNKKVKLIKSNSLNYNQVIKLKKNKIKNSYIVFLDENITNHPDAHILGEKASYSRKKYWSEMRLIFENLNKKNNKKIIICLHPKSSRSDIFFVKNFFNKSKYKVVHNKTLECVAKSYLVVAHFSSSIHFAISLKKYLILIKLRNFNDFQNKSINFYSKELQIPIIENSNFNLGKFLNKKKYKYFFDKYICATRNKKHEISWIRIINYCKLKLC